MEKTADSALHRPRAPIVLVVDDDAEMRSYMQQCLAPLQVNVVEAGSGAEALQHIESGIADDLALVVTDIHMPGMDGRALRDAILAHERCRSVPVLLVTGESQRSRDGPTIRKPFNAAKLGSAARRLLKI